MKSKGLKVRELVLGTIIIIPLLLCIVFYGAIPDKMIISVGQAWDKWILWILLLLSVLEGGYVLFGELLPQKKKAGRSAKQSGRRSRLSGSVRLMLLIAAALAGVFTGAVIITQLFHFGLDIVRLIVAEDGVFILVDGWLLSGIYRHREGSEIMQKVFALRSKLLILCGIAAIVGGVIFGGTIALGILGVCLLLYLCAFAASAYITSDKKESTVNERPRRVRKAVSDDDEPKAVKSVSDDSELKSGKAKSRTADAAGSVRKKRTAAPQNRGKHTAAPAKKRPAAPARPKAVAKPDEFEDLFSSSDRKPANAKPKRQKRNEDADEIYSHSQE